MIAIAKQLKRIKGCLRTNAYETVLHLNLQITALQEKYTITKAKHQDHEESQYFLDDGESEWVRSISLASLQT